MHKWRIFLLPFSLIFSLIVRVRNYLFDTGRLKSHSFNSPVIGIGNLTTGGTGKTPHIEYLVKNFKAEYLIATLSRGYGRKSKGYILAELPNNTRLIGDEPMQYLSKFRNILVAVSEDRVEAIKNLLKREIPPQLILMDDAFQHRRVKPGLNILLLDYDFVFSRDYLLPAGNMREPLSSMRRADIIIISKSPSILAPVERKKIQEYIAILSNKPVFFTFMIYGELTRVFGNQQSMKMGLEYYREKNFTILLVAGIANPSGLIEYLRRYTDKLEVLLFKDHHEFTKKDIQNLHRTFDSLPNNKIIITTEKDAMRFKNPDADSALQKLPLFYLPIEVVFHHNEKEFKQLIHNFVKSNLAGEKTNAYKNT